MYTIDCNGDEEECEWLVDEYLNSYCACSTFTTTEYSSPPHTAIPSTNQISPSRTNAMAISTVSPLYSQPNGVTCGKIIDATSPPTVSVGTQLLPSTEEVYRILAIGLGTLVILLVTLLIVVTTGWVCTCRTKTNHLVKVNPPSR